MKNKTFYKVLFTVTGVCLALTIALFVYTAYAYQHCSIIYFIANELWRAV